MVYTAPRYGSDIIVDQMQAYGLEYVSLNPGASFRGLHDSLVNYGQGRPAIIECTHEEIAVFTALGYARATGKPMGVILHDVVGLLHANQSIYLSFLEKVPMIIMGGTGPMDTQQRRPHTDWNHTAQVQASAIRDYIKWDDQPASIEGVPEAFARAYKTAVTEPKGPVYLCFDVPLQEDPLPSQMPQVNVQRVPVPTRIAPDATALAQVADLLIQAENPVIMAQYVGRNHEAVPYLTMLAELLALPVLDHHGRLNFPTNHPLNLTGSNLRESADLILALDMSDLYGALTRRDPKTRRSSYVTPSGCKIVEIGLGDLGMKPWSQGFQRFQETDLSILADTSLALLQLLELCQARVHNNTSLHTRFERRAQALGKQHDSLIAGWQEQAQSGWDKRPIATARLAHETWEAIKGEDWTHAGSNLNNWMWRLWEFTNPAQHNGTSLGTSTQAGCSLGVALAHKDDGKLVVAIQPDGDLMFDVGVLWTAMHERLPMLMVMFNNRAYYNDWQHQIVVAQHRGTPPENAYIGMEIANPSPDFAALAKSFGWYAEGPIDNPEEVQPALKRAIEVIKKEGRPALVDTITQHR